MIDSEEKERKTVRLLTVQKVQDVSEDKFRKDDKLRKKVKGTKSNDKETFDQEVSDDETDTVSDGNTHTDVT